MKLDTSTSQGRLLRHILAAFAEYESDVKADYCRANYMRRKMEGKPWGSAPFGYVGGGDWRPDEKAAPILRSIFTRYADGMSASRIALELNMAGVPTVKAKHWSGSRIAKILDNPVYAGLLIYDDSLVKGTWEPLVEQALWDHVRARRNADPRRRAHLGQAPRPSTYLLSGLLWCGQCGRKMNHSKGRRRGTVYVCSGDAWSSWDGCLNATFDADQAEAIVGRAFVDRCGFKILTEAGVRAGDPEDVWDEATLPEKRRLLGLGIEKIVASPMGEGIEKPDGNGGFKHELLIDWKAEKTDGDLIIIAEPAAPPTPREVKTRISRYQKLRAHDLASLVTSEREEPE
jgi:hypothetical protein